MKEGEYDDEPPLVFLVVPDQMVLIPADSHFSWLTMFYLLPKELVEKRPEYLNLPRNIRNIADNEEYMKVIRDDSFTEFVWSCYAYANWHFFTLLAASGLSRPSKRHLAVCLAIPQAARK